MEHRIPSTAEPISAKGSPHEGVDALNAVDLLVGEGVPVGIALKPAGARHIDLRDLLEQPVGRQNPDAAILLERGRTALARQHDVARIPRELIVPGVVVALRGHEAAGVTLESSQGVAPRAKTIDDLHRAEVVDSRIQTELVQDGNAGRLRFGVHGRDLRREIARGDERGPGGNRIAGHLRVQEGRQHADDEIRRLDFLPTRLGVARVEGKRGRRGMAFRLARRQLRIEVADAHGESFVAGILEKMTDQRGARTARSEDDDALGHAPKFGGTKGGAKN